MNPLNLYYTLRAYVDSYAGILGRRFLALVWLIALAIIIWFYGSYVGFGSFQPLAPEKNRLIAIGVVFVGWLGWVIWSWFRRDRADKAMIDAVAGDGERQAAAEARAEVDVLRGRLKEAMALLRKVVRRRFGTVYELPWYLVMGAPGSGKTTSIVNSGLKFPLGEGLGAEPVRGVGGTRNCNWWFAEEAILIDTAGRYTTQGDARGLDKAGWHGFLKLLRKHRRAQPLNGVVVTLSIADLLDRDPDEQLAEVRAVRQRLSEMDEVFAARVPVYLVLTKADLLDGFVPFFDGLARTEREQVWGMTFDLPLSQTGTEVPDAFVSEFELLRGRVGAMLMERLQQEPDIEERGRIFRLPAQLARLRDPMREVLTELCSGSKLVSAPLVRGVYLASGTQGLEDMPVPVTAAAGRSARTLKRSYFLSRLFAGVIFEEAALVARDKRLTGRRLMLRRVAAGAAACAVALVFAGWTAAFLHNRAAINEADAASARYAALAKDIPVRNVADEEFLRVLPALDALRQAEAGFEATRALPIDFGLDQREKIAGNHRLAYARALNALLLPRLMVHLQNELRRADRPAGETFDTLKLYAMLGGLGPVDPDYAANRAARIFAALYPGDGNTGTREALTAHVEAMVERPIAPIQPDARLVADARAKVRGIQPAERVLDVLAARPEVAALPAWRPADAAGVVGSPAFARRSGAAMSDGVEGLYTKNGFQAAVLLGIGSAAEAVAKEYWVRGEPAAAAPAPYDVAKAATQLYFARFEETWRTTLADIEVRPAPDLAGMTETARLLAAEPRPIEALARSVADATDLRAVPLALPAEASLGSFVTSANAAPAGLPFDASTVPDPYADLREALVAPKDGKSRIEAIAPLVDGLYGQLSRATSSSAEVAQIFDVDGQLVAANQALLAETRRLPEPVGRWTGSLAAGVDALAVKTARNSLDAAWQGDGAKVCQAAIAGRYPFDRNTDRDVAMDDFIRVFGPNGTFEKFEARLAPFVDRTGGEWRWKGALGTGGLRDEALDSFELAGRIRQAFFPSGEKPAIRLDITPVSLADAANAVVLEIDGSRVVYFHGPIQPKSITWPATTGDSSLARVVFQPGGWEKALSRGGPWSALRLFDEARIKQEGPDRFRATFDASGASAAFNVQVGSIINPFATGALSRFRCPTRL
ncbi:type VI secretion system membrane subunit TssM [Aureimonas leprariae]|uniref:Type VI secretion system membrane subunit TssM n=1 Tax=Plantimonas leprariae TaxID=2615207 RepID=A0A7V7TX09_9HYPH|nr:type VI secretion system membrane subunit TssM [Aureimonas leprariae]KAB0680234.1 type VI secretion system membrane subunit TssM [Aureimonas leprariae]